MPVDVLRFRSLLVPNVGLDHIQGSSSAATCVVTTRPEATFPQIFLDYWEFLSQKTG